MCCAVLCCAVLCCAVLCRAVLCCAVLPCCAVLCCAVPCRAVPCCAVLCCAVLCCGQYYHSACELYLAPDPDGAADPMDLRARAQDAATNVMSLTRKTADAKQLLAVCGELLGGSERRALQALHMQHDVDSAMNWLFEDSKAVNAVDAALAKSAADRALFVDTCKSDITRWLDALGPNALTVCRL
jgi:hypothetical protein